MENPITPSHSFNDIPGMSENDLTRVAFRWKGAANEVEIAGTFSGWQRIGMRKYGEDRFEVTMLLAPQIYSFKYVVDGEWMCSNDHQRSWDSQGNENNLISVTLPKHTVSSKPRKPSAKLRGDSAPVPPFQRLLQNQFMLEGVTPGGDNTQNSSRKLLLVMVGLPARGKSYISQKLRRYLHWLGYSCRIFNIGTYRRQNLGAFHNHDFFRPDNPQGVKARHAMATLAHTDLMEWLTTKGDIGILDGTNSTVARREFVVERTAELAQAAQCNVKVIFIEVLCNDEDVIHQNLLMKHQHSPDYRGMSEEDTLADFRARLAHYEHAYQTIENRSHSFIKIFNVGEETQTNRIKGYLPTKIVFYLMNMHVIRRPIYLTRHGESQFNLENRIGGDSPLTDLGHAYARELSNFMHEEASSDSPHLASLDDDLVVWCSTMVRTQQTAATVPNAQLVRWMALEEISVGICDGMTPEQFQATYPDEYAARINDKLNYRYPRGEGYRDLIRRLEPVIIELERTTQPILVIGHQAVLRCLYGYLMGMNIEEMPHTPIPLHTVIRLQPAAYTTIEDRFPLMPHTGSENVGSVDQDDQGDIDVNDSVEFVGDEGFAEPDSSGSSP